VSLLQKIKDRLFPAPDTTNAVPVYAEAHLIKREFVKFANAYRIGILGYYNGSANQDAISNYKKKLEQLGYECDVLLFFDKKERDLQLYLPYFDTTILNKKTGIPESSKTDLFQVKKFDLLINLFPEPIPALMYMAQHAQARCRVAPHLPFLEEVSDIMVPVKEGQALSDIIDIINNTLELKPYVRH
jgi:hypothetical protein